MNIFQINIIYWMFFFRRSLENDRSPKQIGIMTSVISKWEKHALLPNFTVYLRAEHVWLTERYITTIPQKVRERISYLRAFLDDRAQCFLGAFWSPCFLVSRAYLGLMHRASRILGSSAFWVYIYLVVIRRPMTDLHSACNIIFAVTKERLATGPKQG